MFSHPWRVVVPVKNPQIGKSRLSPLPEMGAVTRPVLARAIAMDTIAAVVEAVGAEATIVVTDDRGLIEAWQPRGIRVVPDPGAGLNPAIEDGWALARGLEPAARRPALRYAAVLGDLPALRAADLRSALELGEPFTEFFVPDAEGTGTVLRAGDAPRARFGPGSAARHQADGATPVGDSLASLRRDVDDPASLLSARRLGLGEATSALLDQRSIG